jgi:aryl-alcohol dehydrogenase-like predicted oxidoreductase
LSTKRIRYLEENVKALDVKLTPEDLKRIDRIAAPGVAAGPRYSEAAMQSVNR